MLLLLTNRFYKIRLIMVMGFITCFLSLIPYSGWGGSRVPNPYDLNLRVDVEIDGSQDPHFLSGFIGPSDIEGELTGLGVQVLRVNPPERLWVGQVLTMDSISQLVESQDVGVPLGDGFSDIQIIRMDLTGWGFEIPSFSSTSMEQARGPFLFLPRVFLNGNLHLSEMLFNSESEKGRDTEGTDRTGKEVGETVGVGVSGEVVVDGNNGEATRAGVSETVGEGAKSFWMMWQVRRLVFLVRSSELAKKQVKRLVIS